MIKLVWDQVRRWWWLWLAVGVAYGCAVWFGVPDKPDWTTAFFPAAMYVGLLPLSQDISRGDVLRLLRTLPVSAKQIGRAWWWASVGLPGLMLGVITRLVFVLVPALSHRTISGAGCFRFWLSNTLLFGFMFFLQARGPSSLLRKDAVRRTAGECRYMLLFFVSYFAVLMYFYWLFPPQTIRWDGLIAAATGLSIASWFGTEAFARRQLEILPTKAAQVRAVALAGQIAQARVETWFKWIPGVRNNVIHGVAGPGGLGLLFRTTFYRLLGPGLFLVILIGLMLHWTVPAENYDSFFTVVWRLLAVMYWFAILGFTLSGRPQMRLLRTLPVSSARLAGVCVFTPVAALLGFMVPGGLALGLLFGEPLRFVLSLFHSGCPLLIATTTLTIPLFLWLGYNQVLSLVLFLGLVMAGGLTGLLFQEHLSLPVNLALCLLLVGAAFGLTKVLVERSRRVYGPRPG